MPTPNLNELGANLTAVDEAAAAAPAAKGKGAEGKKKEREAAAPPAAKGKGAEGKKKEREAAGTAAAAAAAQGLRTGSELPPTPPRGTVPLDAFPVTASSGQSRGRASSVNSKGRSRSPSPSGKTQERTTALLRAVVDAKTSGLGYYGIRALRHGACTDSWHDFHKQAYNETDRAQNGTFGLYDTLQGLPALGAGSKPFPLAAKNPDIDSLHDENEIMIELFSGFTINGYNLSQNVHPNFFMDTLIRKLVENLENGGTDPNHTFRCLDGDNNYNVKLLHKKLDAADPNFNIYGHAMTNVPTLVGNYRLNTNEIYDFFGTADINLLFDASVIDVLGVIRNCAAPLASAGVPPKTLRVNRIINRELINDPAPKTYEFKKGVRPGAAGNNVTASILFDDETEPVVYSEYGTPRELNRDKFYSIFNFNLGRLKYTTKSLPTISLDIKNSTGDVMHFDDNPHAGNEISHCWERMCSIAEKSPSKHYDASVHFQCKRSGDWLQALSCFDTGRKYINYTYEGKKRTNPQPFIVKGDKIILVTHDRVLLYYGILLGLDVIMTYKIPPTNEARKAYKEKLAQAAAAASAPASGDDDDDDDDGSAEVYIDHEGRSNKYILYFQNTKRLGGYVAAAAPPPVDPAVAAAAAAADLITKKNTFIGLSATMEDNILKYNNNVNTIIMENEAEIIDINAIILNDASKKDDSSAKQVAQANTSASLVQSYIKLCCANYKCIDSAKYKTLADAVRGINVENLNQNDNLANMKEFISLHDNLAAKLAKLNAKEKIEQLHANYKKSPQYKNLVNLGCLTKAAWGRRKRDGIDKSASTNVIEMATYFIQNLHQNHLKNLVYDLQFAADKIKADECLLKQLLSFIRTLCPVDIGLNDLYDATGKLNIQERAVDKRGRCVIETGIMAKLKTDLAGAAKGDKAGIKDRISIQSGAPVPVDYDSLGGEAKGKIIDLMVSSGVIGEVYKAITEENAIVSELKRRTAVFEEKCAVSEAGMTWETQFKDLIRLANLSSEEADKRDAAAKEKEENDIFLKSISELNREYIDIESLITYYTPPVPELMGITIKDTEYFTAVLNDDIMTYSYYIVKLNQIETLIKKEEEGEEFIYNVKVHLEPFGIKEEEVEDMVLQDSGGERKKWHITKPNYVEIMANNYYNKYVEPKIAAARAGRLAAKHLVKYLLTLKFLYNKALEIENTSMTLTLETLDRILYKNPFPYDSFILDWVRIADSDKFMRETGVDKTLIAALNDDAATGNADKEIGASSRKPVVLALDIKEGGVANPAENLDAPATVATTAEAARHMGDSMRKETYIHTTIDKTVELIGTNLYEVCGSRAGEGAIRRNANRRIGQQMPILEGGGNKNNMLVISHIFVIFYLRRLMYDLRGFEKSGDEDYKYYETLACLVISACGDYNRRDSEFYNKLQAILFDAIPEYDLVVDGTDDDYIIGGRGHAANVQFIGRQVALQCCGYSTGEIVALGNIGLIDASVKTNYIMLRNKLCDLPYGARKSTLISLLSRRIVDYKPPNISSSGISVANFTAAFSKPRQLTGLPVNRTGRLYNRPNSFRTDVKVTSGGRKTRKLKKRKNNTKAVTRVNRRTRSRR